MSQAPPKMLCGGNLSQANCKLVSNQSRAGSIVTNLPESAGAGACLCPALKRQHPALEHAIRAEPAPNSFPDRIGDAVVLAVFPVALHEFHDRRRRHARV